MLPRYTAIDVRPRGSRFYVNRPSREDMVSGRAILRDRMARRRLAARTLARTRLPGNLRNQILSFI